MGPAGRSRSAAALRVGRTGVWEPAARRPAAESSETAWNDGGGADALAGRTTHCRVIRAFSTVLGAALGRARTMMRRCVQLSSSDELSGDCAGRG